MATEYFLLEYDNLSKFNAELNYRVIDGWMPFMNVVVTHRISYSYNGNNNYTTIYSQMLMRVTPDKPKGKRNK